MKMIRAGGVFNFREMIAHVNSNKKLQDFYNSFFRPALNTWFYVLSLFFSGTGLDPMDFHVCYARRKSTTTIKLI